MGQEGSASRKVIVTPRHEERWYEMRRKYRSRRLGTFTGDSSPEYYQWIAQYDDLRPWPNYLVPLEGV